MGAPVILGYIDFDRPCWVFAVYPAIAPRNITFYQTERPTDAQLLAAMARFLGHDRSEAP